ncbi:MAG: peptidylprolyl isomerase, partial [Spirochaetota bacterium]
PAMVSFRHVYVDLRGKSDAERQEARELLDGYRRRIRNGSTSFEELEDEALDNPLISADNFGYLLRNDTRNQQLLGRAFVEAVFGLEEGEVEGVLESNVALHIVRITDKRAPRILTLDDPILPGRNVTVRQQIRALLASQKEQRALAAAVEEVVDTLRDEADITIFQENLPW